MNGRVAKKIRREIRRQYWKNFSRKPWGVPWLMWEKLMKRAFFAFYPKRNKNSEKWSVFKSFRLYKPSR